MLNASNPNGWTDGTDDRYADRQTDFQVESHLGERQMSYITDIQTDLSCY